MIGLIGQLFGLYMNMIASGFKFWTRLIPFLFRHWSWTVWITSSLVLGVSGASWFVCTVTILALVGMDHIADDIAGWFNLSFKCEHCHTELTIGKQCAGGMTECPECHKGTAVPA